VQGEDVRRLDRLIDVEEANPIGGFGQEGAAAGTELRPHHAGARQHREQAPDDAGIRVHAPGDVGGRDGASALGLEQGQNVHGDDEPAAGHMLLLQ